MKYIFAALLLSLTYPELVAQITPDKDFRKIAEETYSPAKKSSLLNTLSQLNLTSDFGDEEATGTISVTDKRGTYFSLYLSQSFDEKPKIVNPVNLEGLQSNSSFELAVQKVLWNPAFRAGNNFETIRDEWAKRTYHLVSSEYTLAELDSVETRLEDSAMKLKLKELKLIWTDANETAKKTALIDEISGFMLRSVGIGDMDETARDAIKKDNSIDWGRPVLLGVAFGLGSVNYDYISDSFALKPEELKGANFNLRFSIGMYVNTSDILAVSYILENKFKAGDPVNFSFPVGTTTTFNKDVIITKPSTQIDHRFKLEYRANWYKEGVPLLGLNPQLSYYTSKEILALEVPIYFLNFKKDDVVKGLQGGISFGVLHQFKKGDERDKSLKDFAVSAFIAAPFETLGLFKTR